MQARHGRKQKQNLKKKTKKPSRCGIFSNSWHVAIYGNPFPLCHFHSFITRQFSSYSGHYTLAGQKGNKKNIRTAACKENGSRFYNGRIERKDR
jgi:hypothetical protein